MVDPESWIPDSQGCGDDYKDDNEVRKIGKSIILVAAVSQVYLTILFSIVCFPNQESSKSNESVCRSIEWSTRFLALTMMTFTYRIHGLV